jgi:DNA-binding transcriptional regulator YiaG
LKRNETIGSKIMKNKILKKNKNPGKNQIKRLREKRGVSLQALARLIGTSVAHMEKLESGKAILTSHWLLSLAANLKVNSNVIADVPVSKKITDDCDDALLGDTLGWLLEYSDKMKITLSRQELSKWAGYVYKEVIAQRLNLQQSRFLILTIIRVMRDIKGK